MIKKLLIIELIILDNQEEYNKIKIIKFQRMNFKLWKKQKNEKLYFLKFSKCKFV